MPSDAAKKALEELEKSIGGMGGGGSFGPPTRKNDEPRVYVGTKPKAGGSAGSANAAERGKTAFSGQTRDSRPQSDVVADFYRWSDKERQEWGDYLVSLGLLDPEENTYANQREAWLDMVNEAAQFSVAGKPTTPRDVAKMYAVGKVAKGADEPFTGTKKQTSKNFDYTNPDTARNYTNQLFQQALGREATPEEIQEFAASLQQAEAASPVVSVSETQYEAGEAVGQTTTRSGGMDASMFIRDRARAMPGYGEYQAATTYFNALMGAIASPV